MCLACVDASGDSQPPTPPTVRGTRHLSVVARAQHRSEFFQSNRRFNATPAQRLYRGLLYAFLGAVFILARFISGDHDGPWSSSGQTLTGLLLIAAGAANLLFYVLDARRTAATTDTTAADTKDARQ